MNQCLDMHSQGDIPARKVLDAMGRQDDSPVIASWPRCWISWYQRHTTTASPLSDLAWGLAIIEESRAGYATTNAGIIVTSEPQVTETTWPFLSVANGSTISVPVIFGSNTLAVANLTRARPEAYIFSGAWAETASKLRATGLEVKILAEGFSGEVEALNITAATLAKTKFEGVAQTTGIETTMSLRDVTFPAGAFWVSSRQRRAAHAFMRLEPEAESSFVVWNVLPVVIGDEYLVYRVPRRRRWSEAVSTARAMVFETACLGEYNIVS
jgi:hypothetical protein